MPSLLAFNDNVGETIPADTPHAISVSLPTWKANVGYEEGEAWVLDRMQCGYPRFYIHKTIDRLATTIVTKYGQPDQKALLFPSAGAAQRCVQFFKDQKPPVPMDQVRILNFVPNPHKTHEDPDRVLPRLSAVLYHKSFWPVAKQVWQHTGEGTQSRRAEYCEKALQDGYMILKEQDHDRMPKGPRRYQRQSAADIKGHNGVEDSNGTNGTTEGQEPAQFVEERFGRNLNISFANSAKLAVKRRIAGSLSHDMDVEEALARPEEVEKTRTHGGFSVDDVYLFPCGMNAIYSAHRYLMLAKGRRKSVSFGFPYVDTLKVLEKWGPGAIFYGHGSADDLTNLEQRLAAGERILALFCEFPGNPMLTSPDLQRIRKLADQYGFAVVIDETIGNFLNVNVLPYADVIVSSLTKIFSGDSNVMGGAAILNPSSRYYISLKRVMDVEYEDNVFEEDAVFLERNSRDFVSRIARVNANAEIICDMLLADLKVKQVNYPKHSPSRQHYEACRLPHGGYGGLLSCTFHSIEDAKVFYDHLDTAKGPSLGTNFTLSSPYVILAHYQELDWAAQYGCEASLIRFSVGLEEESELRRIFGTALDAIQQL